jgi:hypothetical protein
MSFNTYMGGNATLKHFRGFVEVIAESFLNPNSGFIFVSPGENRDIVWGPIDYQTNTKMV